MRRFQKRISAMCARTARKDKVKILIVDDDAAFCRYLHNILSRFNHSVHIARSGEEALECLDETRPDLAILDLVLPDINGLEVLSRIRQRSHKMPVIMLTGYGQTSTVVMAMKLGAKDFLNKPFYPAELEASIEKVLQGARVKTPTIDVPRKFGPEKENFDFIFGHSQKMKDVKSIIEQVADTDITVLLRGGSGTGKDLAARMIYAISGRRDRPYVKVNCAALPEQLLESELFGYEKGAFTGAQQRKPGKFEFANSGTVLLDEISEMKPSLQAKLLQVLQDGHFSPLGGAEEIKVDVRIIAASNRNLERRVKDGRFREDLFYRLNVVNIHLPDLCERREEIPQLIDFFLDKYGKQYEKSPRKFRDSTQRFFNRYHWPGNIRELENICKRYVILGNEAAICAGLKMPAGDSSGGALTGSGGESNITPLKEVGKEAARDAETKLISHVLDRTRWNRRETSRILQISYKALLYKIKSSGLDKTDRP
jgi:two-component system response regulator AtoC